MAMSIAHGKYRLRQEARYNLYPLYLMHRSSFDHTVSCQLFVSHIPTGTFQIFLSNFKVAWRVQLSSPCDSTRIEIYETSSTESALKGSFCFGSIPDLVIDSSVAFIRVFSPALSIKPELTFSYTVLRDANRPTFVTSNYGMRQYLDN